MGQGGRRGWVEGEGNREWGESEQEGRGEKERERLINNLQ